MGRVDKEIEALGLAKQESTFHTSYAGLYDAYYTVVEIQQGAYSENSLTIRMGISMRRDQSGEIASLEEALFNQLKLKVVDSSAHSIEVKRPLMIRMSKNIELIQSALSLMSGHLRSLGIESGDFINGDQDSSVSLYLIENTYHYLSDRSYMQLSSELRYKEEQVEAEHPDRSIFTGLGGAFLGALVGAIVWAILLYFGYYAWFAAILSTTLAFHFYEKQKGIINAKSSILITAIVLLTLVLANIMTYAFIFTRGLAEFNMSFSLALLNLYTLLREFDLMTSFVMDLLLGIGISILFAIILAHRLYKTASRKNKIDKV